MIPLFQGSYIQSFIFLKILLVTYFVLTTVCNSGQRWFHRALFLKIRTNRKVYIYNWFWWAFALLRHNLIAYLSILITVCFFVIESWQPTIKMYPTVGFWYFIQCCQIIETQPLVSSFLFTHFNHCLYLFLLDCCFKVHPCYGILQLLMASWHKKNMALQLCYH